jgi:hypothetical protein
MNLSKLKKDDNQTQLKKLETSSGLLVSVVVIATLLGSLYLIYKNTK